MSLASGTCPRCFANTPVDADECRDCGAPLYDGPSAVDPKQSDRPAQPIPSKTAALAETGEG